MMGCCNIGGSSRDAVMLEQMEATEKRQWCCNTWKQGRWSRAATGGSSKATCSGAAIDKGSRVDPMVLQRMETVEDAVVLQQVEATYIRHNVQARSAHTDCEQPAPGEQGVEYTGSDYQPG